MSWQSPVLLTDHVLIAWCKKSIAALTTAGVQLEIGMQKHFHLSLHLIQPPESDLLSRMQGLQKQFHCAYFLWGTPPLVETGMLISDKAWLVW